MADLKIDETEFFYYLTKTKELLEQIELCGELAKEKEVVLQYIEEQYEIRGLMLQRKSYYDFYTANRTEHPESANKAYQAYIDIKKQIEEKRMRGL